MEETLTDCLVRVREDLSQLKKVRDFLDTNADTEEHCSVTWRTIEAFNSILSVCSSQNTPETNALDTLLDSFYYLARNNNDDSVWEDFGFELGIICVKVLSAIERSEIFEILFCKLLSVISIICEHNSNVWKAAARQILNVLINKKFSLSYLEEVVKLYICMLKNIEGSALSEFSSQNLHLLKTLSLLVQKIGDFEIQSSVIELVFLHLSKETKLMSDFFSTAEAKLFQSLQFTDFERDCRLYLNAVNKPRKGFERKVFSICCHVLYLGGCFVEPPLGKTCLWVDANKDSERVSIKCADENETRVLLIQFSDLIKVQLEHDKTEGNPCLTIRTKNLMSLHTEATNDDICLVADNNDEVFEFVRFLEATIDERKRKKKFGGRGSKTIDCLLIDRNSPKLQVQDNAITSSERPGIDHILPDVLNLFEKANQTTPPKIKTQSQQLSPNSFVESLNKHIGLGSPEPRHTYEDSVETIEFLQKVPTGHKLFRSPNKIFEVPDTIEPDFNFSFGDDKENMPGGVFKSRIKTYTRKSRKIKPADEPQIVLSDRKNIEIKIPSMQSQDYFRTDSSLRQKKKPCFPKLKRNNKQTKQTKENKLDTTDDSKTPPQEKERENVRETSKNGNKHRERHKTNPIEHKQEFRLHLEIKEKRKSKEKSPNGKPEPQKKGNKPETESTNRGKTQTTDPNAKPSLLDPNGYAYQRWCKPTTSERSNFWLKKLTATQKPKIDSDSIFDFSEDSESILSKRKNKKRVVHSKPKGRTDQTSLRQVKEILKKSPPKVKPKASPPGKQTTATESPPRTTALEPIAEIPSPASINQQPGESEYESLSEGEVQEQTEKRERSDDSSRREKKRSKCALPKNLLLTLRRRLRKTEQKDRQQTDEIIQTINRATSHLFNHLQRKDGQRVVSYLNTAEAASAAFDSEIDDLHLRLKRIQRAILYYRAGCSVSDFCESLDGHLSKVREAVKEFRGKKDTSKTIDRVNGRLADLIKSEIEKSIGNEWASKRSQLLKSATILGVDFREFG